MHRKRSSTRLAVPAFLVDDGSMIAGSSRPAEAPTRAFAQGALVATVIALVAGCAGDPPSSRDPTSTTRPPTAADAVVQMRPVEATDPDLPLTCEEGASCSHDLLLDEEGITLAGPQETRYELGHLIIVGSDIAGVADNRQTLGGPSELCVSFELTDAAAQRLEVETTRLVTLPAPRNRIAVIVEGRILAAPYVAAPIANGQGEICAIRRSDVKPLLDLFDQ
jgi:hypothetical protein